MPAALVILSILAACALPATATAGTSQRELIAAARAAPAVQQELAAHPGLTPVVVRLPTGTEVRWINARGQGVAMRMTPTGRIRKVFTGYQATWELTRG